jgi:rhodanese-related sulfurtransferase
MKKFAVSLALAFSSVALSHAPIALAEAAAHAPEISLPELKKVVATKAATIIDANGVDMYKKGHIPGAISFAENGTKLATMLPADKATPIVAYCGGPMCEAWQDAAKAVQALGYTNVKHFKGGIKGWKDAGEHMDKGA